MAIVALVFALITIPKVGTAAVKSDASLAIYASQQIANGGEPYANYIIMHPPLPHLAGAGALLIGRAIGVEDVISIRMMCLFLSLSIILVVTLIGEKFRPGLGILAAAAGSWNILMLMTVWGMHVKLVMLLFYALLLWMLMKKIWLAAGVFLGLAVLSWSGGVVFAGIVFLVWLFSKDDRKMAAWKILIGFLLVVLVAVLILGLSGSFPAFYNQFVLSLGQYFRNKAFGQGVRDTQFGLGNIFRSGALSIPDLLILFSGLGAMLGYVFTHKDQLTKEIPGLTLFIAAILSGGMILFDYQSPFDLLPLLPPLTVFFAWLATLGIEGWIRLWKTDFSTAYVVLILIMLSVVRFSAIQDIPDRLSDQRKAAEWLSGAKRGDYSIQAFGDLSMLVLSGEQNALPVIHAGPKTYLAMGNTGWTIERVIDEIRLQQPGIVSLDVRNSRKTYLTPLMAALSGSYVYIGNTSEPSLHIYASCDQPEAVVDSIAFVQLHQGEKGFEDAGASSDAPEDWDAPEGRDIYVTTDELAEIEVTSVVRFDEFHLVFSNALNRELVLYWWSQTDTPFQAQIGLRWLGDSGLPLSEWHLDQVGWLPGYSSKSAHVLPDRPDDGRGLEICVLGLDPGLGDLVCQGDSMILVMPE